ncbi:MAG: prepilin-type N-terminal cleavage/methylation domain-containing protein [Rhodanobacter sp.]
MLPRGAGEEANARSALFHKSAGFTLLEVIAAIALLAIAFTVLMRVAGGSTRLSENAADHSEAALWARSLLDTAYTSEPLQPGSTSGRFDERFRWRLDVTRWRPGSTPAQAPLQLYQLDLAVSWGPQEHPRTAHFRTLRLAAAEPGQALP